LLQNGRLVAAGEVDEDGEFHAKTILSHEYRSDDESSTIFTLPVGTKIRADVFEKQVG
jgi:hypothetical protein